MNRPFLSFAKGSSCFSVGFLAFSLTGLMQPAASVQPPATPPGPSIATTAPTPPPPAETPAPTATLPAPDSAPAATAENLLPLDFEEHGVPEAPFGDLIYDMAGRYAVNPYLVAAVVEVESAFNPRAVSRKGARGLMQLLPATARRFGVQKKKDLFNPAKNIEAGIRYLKWLSERFRGDTARVLAAYNAGEGAVDRFGGVPPYEETRNYVTRIFGILGLVPALESPLDSQQVTEEYAVAAGR